MKFQSIGFDTNLFELTPELVVDGEDGSLKMEQQPVSPVGECRLFVCIHITSPDTLNPRERIFLLRHRDSEDLVVGFDVGTEVDIESMRGRREGVRG